MKHTFVAMPGILKHQAIDDILVQVEDELQVQTGEMHRAGFSTHSFFEDHAWIRYLDKKVLDSPLSGAYWDFTMQLCLQSMRRHDVLLAMLPRPVELSDYSFTKGVATEIQDAYAHHMPVYVAETDSSAQHLEHLWRPKDLNDFEQQYKINLPSDWLLSSSIWAIPATLSSRVLETVLGYSKRSS